MAEKKSYSQLVGEAEQAVSAVKDAELRRVAFERVLEDLLGAKTGGHDSEDAVSAKRIAKRPAPSAGRRKVPRGRPSGSRRGGPRGYIEELIADGFFKKPKTMAEVKAELGNRGHHIPRTSLSGPLQKLCQDKLLRRQKMSTEGGKKTYGYSNW